MIALCFVVAFLVNRTPFGFEIRTVGTNPDAARYAGMRVNRTIILVMALSGAFAGLAGSTEILGTSGFLSPGVFVAIGFDSIAIALLARANPYGIIPAAILWGSMLSGSGLMQQETGLSIDAVRIVQALVLLFVAADVIVRTVFRIKKGEGRGLRDHEHHLGLGWRHMSTAQRRTIGVLFGILGIVLVGAVAPNLDSATRAFTFETPPDPATFSFTPSVLVIAIGIIFILTAVIDLPRQARRAVGTHRTRRRRRPSSCRSSSSSASPCRPRRTPTSSSSWSSHSGWAPRSHSERWPACGASAPVWSTSPSRE